MAVAEHDPDLDVGLVYDPVPVEEPPFPAGPMNDPVPVEEPPVPAGPMNDSRLLDEVLNTLEQLSRGELVDEDEGLFGFLQGYVRAIRTVRSGPGGP